MIFCVCLRPFVRPPLLLDIICKPLFGYDVENTWKFAYYVGRDIYCQWWRVWNIFGCCCCSCLNWVWIQKCFFKTIVVKMCQIILQTPRKMDIKMIFLWCLFLFKFGRVWNKSSTWPFWVLVHIRLQMRLNEFNLSSNESNLNQNKAKLSTI